MPFDIAPKEAAAAIRKGEALFPIQAFGWFYNDDPRSACTWARLVIGLGLVKNPRNWIGSPPHWAVTRLNDAYRAKYRTGICEDNNAYMTSEDIAKRIEALEPA